MWMLLIGLAVIVIGAYLYVSQARSAFGPDGYVYECDEHVTFGMTPAAGLDTVYVKPLRGGTYPPEGGLVRDKSAAGVRFEGNGVVMKAYGEMITIGEGDSAINCSPVTAVGITPFNFDNPLNFVSQ